jgi:putative addiction module component (TIGR02574 family)
VWLAVLAGVPLHLDRAGQDLWDSVIDGDTLPATAAAQQAEIERRAGLADSAQMPGSPWSEVKAALRPKK